MPIYSSLFFIIFVKAKFSIYIYLPINKCQWIPKNVKTFENIFVHQGLTWDSAK